MKIIKNVPTNEVPRKELIVTKNISITGHPRHMRGFRTALHAKNYKLRELKGDKKKRGIKQRERIRRVGRKKNYYCMEKFLVLKFEASCGAKTTGRNRKSVFCKFRGFLI